MRRLEYPREDGGFAPVEFDYRPNEEIRACQKCGRLYSDKFCVYGVDQTKEMVTLSRAVKCPHCGAFNVLNCVQLKVPEPERWYKPGYGVVFTGRWAFIDPFASLGLAYDFWYDFASWHELHVMIFNRDFGVTKPIREIVNEDYYRLAYLDWHWTDDAEGNEHGRQQNHA